jgi:hypothetical protein
MALQPSTLLHRIVLFAVALAVLAFMFMVVGGVFW